MVGHRETGNESYVVNLLRGLAENAGADSFHVLTPDPHLVAAEIELPSQFRLVRVWPAMSALRIPLGIPAALYQQRSELLHATYVLPPRAPCPMVVTVHDLSFIPFPQALTPRARVILQWLVPISVRAAKRVIAISEFTKQDLIRFCNVSPSKIRVTHLAADPAYAPASLEDAAQLPQGVREPFILAVGNLEPRKNLSRLIEAYLSLVANRQFDGQLVLVGNPRSSTHQLSQHLRKLGLESRVVRTGYVAKRQLRSLYNRAAVFAFPSFYEGFGLPALEAMACGCPVVTSNAAALPEVVGEAAIKVRPDSTQELADAIGAVIGRPELARELRAKGLIRASLFSWRQTAEQTRSVYREILEPVAKQR